MRNPFRPAGGVGLPGRLCPDAKFIDRRAARQGSLGGPAGEGQGARPAHPLFVLAHRRHLGRRAGLQAPAVFRAAAARRAAGGGGRHLPGPDADPGRPHRAAHAGDAAGGGRRPGLAGGADPAPAARGRAALDGCRHAAGRDPHRRPFRRAGGRGLGPLRRLEAGVGAARGEGATRRSERRRMAFRPPRGRPATRSSPSCPPRARCSRPPSRHAARRCA